MTRGCLLFVALLLTASCTPRGLVKWDGWFVRANQFDALVEKAATDLESKGVAGFEPSETSRVAKSVRRLNFAALIGLLAARSFEDTSTPDFLETAASAIAKDRNNDSINKEQIKIFLTQVFSKGLRPAEAENNPELRKELLSLGIKHLSKSAMNTYATPEETQEVIRILETGQFWGDALAVTGAVYRWADEMPQGVLRTLLSPDPAIWIISLTKKIPRDLGKLPKTSPKEVILTEGVTKCNAPSVFQESLTEFERLPPINRTAVMLTGVLARENRSARLALILYARSHGVSEIDDDTIDKVVCALDQENPNLGPLLFEAAHRLKTKYGVDRAIQAIDGLK
jgi:hypothetical protein